MEKKKISWKLEDILLHLDFDKKISKEKIKQFLSCLSPESLPSIVGVKRTEKKLLALSIQGEDAGLLVDDKNKTIHLVTEKIVGTTLEKTNSALNEVLGLLSKTAGEKIYLGGMIRILLETDIQAENIVSKLIPESHIQEVSSKIKDSLKAEGIRVTGEKMSMIFDMDKEGKLHIIAQKDFKEEFLDLKKEVEEILSYVESLTIKLGEI